MSNVSREDLRMAVKDIKEHVNNVVSPIKDNVHAQEVMLRGEHGRNGLVGDVNAMKTTHRNVKWALTGGVAGIIAFVKSFIHSG